MNTTKAIIITKDDKMFLTSLSNEQLIQLHEAGYNISNHRVKISWTWQGNSGFLHNGAWIDPNASITQSLFDNFVIPMQRQDGVFKIAEVENKETQPIPTPDNPNGETPNHNSYKMDLINASYFTDSRGKRVEIQAQVNKKGAGVSTATFILQIRRDTDNVVLDTMAKTMQIGGASSFGVVFETDDLKNTTTNVNYTLVMWKSETDLTVLSNSLEGKLTINETGNTNPPPPNEPPQEPIHQDKLMGVLKGVLFSSVALSLLGSKGG